MQRREFFAAAAGGVATAAAGQAKAGEAGAVGTAQLPPGGFRGTRFTAVTCFAGGTADCGDELLVFRRTLHGHLDLGLALGFMEDRCILDLHGSPRREAKVMVVSFLGSPNGPWYLLDEDERGERWLAKHLTGQGG